MDFPVQIIGGQKYFTSPQYKCHLCLGGNGPILPGGAGWCTTCSITSLFAETGRGFVSNAKAVWSRAASDDACFVHRNTPAGSSSHRYTACRET